MSGSPNADGGAAVTPYDDRSPAPVPAPVQRVRRRTLLTTTAGVLAGAAVVASPLAAAARTTTSSVRGVTGPTGPTGPRGATGPAGLRGATGAAGAAGALGLPGAMGTTGSTGPTGASVTGPVLETLVAYIGAQGPSGDTSSSHPGIHVHLEDALNTYVTFDPDLLNIQPGQQMLIHATSPTTTGPFQALVTVSEVSGPEYPNGPHPSITPGIPVQMLNDGQVLLSMTVITGVTT